MRSRRRKRVVGLLLILLVICIAGAIVLHALLTEPVTPPISKHFTAQSVQAQSFEDLMADASRQARTEGRFRLVFTEEQISSWLGLEAASFAERRGSSFPFTNVQAGLDNGIMRVYAQVTTADLNLPMEMIVRPQVDADGHLVFSIDQVLVGGVGLPSFLVDAITGQIKDLIRKPFNRLETIYYMDANTLRVEDGVFVVEGRPREPDPALLTPTTTP